MATTVGKASDIAPGTIVNYLVNGQSIDVANVEGQLYAFDDVCTHIGCSLYDGRLEGTTVTCPCHGSRFDVTTGAVIEGPAGSPVKSYAVQVVGDEVQL